MKRFIKNPCTVFLSSRCMCILLLAICSMLVFTTPAWSQKKMTRKEKEAAWRAERLRKRAAEEQREMRNDSIEHIQAVTAIKNGSWALEASNVTFNNGVTRFVTPSTNFISVNNGNAVVQTAFDNTNIYSPNGLGGITLEGRLTDESMKVDKHGNIYYSYSIVGAQISATVTVVITAGSNQATATIDPNFNPTQMTFSGYIYPYVNSGIIEGSSGYY